MPDEFSISTSFTLLPNEDREFLEVREFHEKFEQVVGDRPQNLTRRKLAERASFILEELLEFAANAGLGLSLEDEGPIHFAPDPEAPEQDIVGQADALIDLVYVAKGTAVMMGLPWRELMTDVHGCNMRKELTGVAARAGYQHKRAQIGKPPGWVGPRTAEILNAAGYDRSKFTSLVSDELHAIYVMDDAKCVDDPDD